MSIKNEERQTITPGDMKVCLRMGGMLYEIGHLFAYQLSTQVEEVPRLVFGEKYAITSTKGRRAHQGTLIFNVINVSVVQELKKILAETSNPVMHNGSFTSQIIDGTFMDTNFENELGEMVKPNTNTDDINAMDLPAFDIIITAQDKLNPNKYSQKRIEGIVIYGQSNAIGLDTVNTQDVYPFMCKHVTPLMQFESDSTELNDAVNDFLDKEENGQFISTLG